MVNKTWIYDLVHRAYRWAHWKNNVLFKEAPKQYVFILSQAYAGSTVLHEILSNNTSVSPLNTFGTREGFGLKVSRKSIDHSRLWDKDYEIPFEILKTEWRKQWDLSAPYLLEKSPPQLLRAHHIQSVFRTCYFISLVRDPYALAISYHQRNQVTIQQAAQYTIQCFGYHQQNQIGLDHMMTLSYETLTDDWMMAKEHLLSFLPKLNTLHLPERFKAHNQAGQIEGLQNMNLRKFKSIDSDLWNTLTDSFKPYESLFNQFGYSLRTFPG